MQKMQGELKNFLVIMKTIISIIILEENMVNKIIKNKIIYFACEECKLLYKDKSYAAKCQGWCSKNKSCNIEIIKHAIKDEENKIEERKEE